MSSCEVNTTAKKCLHLHLHLYTHTHIYIYIYIHTYINTHTHTDTYVTKQRELKKFQAINNNNYNFSGVKNNDHFFLLRELFSPRHNSPWWPGLPHYRGFTITHTDTPKSVGFLWTSDQHDADPSTWQHTTITTGKHPYNRRELNPQSQQANSRRPAP